MGLIILYVPAILLYHLRNNILTLDHFYSFLRNNILTLDHFYSFSIQSVTICF